MVDWSLIVVSRLQHHVQDSLLELVLDQKVRVEEPFEDLDYEVVAAGGGQEHGRGRACRGKHSV